MGRKSQDDNVRKNKKFNKKEKQKRIGAYSQKHLRIVQTLNEKRTNKQNTKKYNE